MSKQKLCMLVGYYPAIRGGAEHQSRLIAEELRKHVEVFYVSIGHESDRLFWDQGIKVHALKPPRGFMPRPLFFLLRSKLLAILKQEKPDWIYQRVCFSATGIAAEYCRKSDARMIWHIANEPDVKPFSFRPSKSFLIDFVEKRIADYGIRNADYIIGQTKHQSKLLSRHYGRECSIIVPNFQLNAADSVKENSKVRIGWVANIKNQKRPDLFIRLAQVFQRQPGIQFDMIGKSASGPLQKLISGASSAMGHFHYWGECSMDEVNEYLDGAHVLVNTSDHEGFPNTFIQAWMRRVPVVSLNVDPDDVMKRNRIGFHSRTFEQMVKDMSRLIQDEALRLGMGGDAREYALKHHSLRNVDLIMDLLRI